MAAYHLPNEKTGATFLEYDKLTEDRFTFMASTKTEVFRELYDLVDQPTMPNLEAELQLGYIGTSSLNSVAILRNKDTGHVLAQNTNQVVTVLKTTRKPSPIADWWKNKYQPLVSGNQRLIVSPLNVPERVYHYTIHVGWSDIDAYKHTNYVSYIRHCLDTAMDGVDKGYFLRFKNDILLYHVKDMEISYKGESKAGDVLDVKTWEDADKPYQLYFDISNAGKTIFQCSMVFFEPML
jgi:acyl-CoA thioesterase FadM